MRRIEERYLVEDPDSDAMAGLWYRIYFEKQYEVDTVYLDLDPPTWSVGKGNKKYRIRWYNGDVLGMFFEAKSGGHKLRRKTSKRFGLKVVGSTKYVRDVYLDDTETVRVTVDNSVRSPEVGNLELCVVEVKRTKGMTDLWWKKYLPEQNTEFSKSKWVTGCWKTK